jgi:hypothetical protein
MVTVSGQKRKIYCNSFNNMTLVATFLQHNWSFDYPNYADMVGNAHMQITNEKLNNFGEDQFGNEDSSVIVFRDTILKTQDDKLLRFLSSSDFTITAWVFDSSENFDSVLLLFYCYSDLNSDNTYFQIAVDGETFNLVLNTIITSSKNKNIKAIVWKHYAITFSRDIRPDTRIVSFYVNGKLIRTATINNFYESMNFKSCQIQQSNSNSNSFLKIDELKIYNAALTDSQILMDMYAQNGQNIPDQSNA